MISSLAALLLAAAAPTTSIEEARQALVAGRPAQARQMIASAVQEGAAGPAVDQLLADLAFAEGRWTEAGVRYKSLLAPGGSDPRLLERAGIAALHAGKLAEAVRLLEQATTHHAGGWQAWNARGVAADRQRDWVKADVAYARAIELAPREAQIRNNQGWSLLLRGHWQQAADTLAKAAALAPANERIAANFDLARSAVDANLPVRRSGETSHRYAARLNDAGVMAMAQGDRAKATAAFAQALAVSDRWFTRAEGNLKVAEER